MARFPFFALSAFVLGSTALPTADGLPVPEHNMVEGATAYRQGSLDIALAQWLEAAREYRARGQGSREIEALMQVAGAQQALGRYREAAVTLERGLSIANAEKPPARLAAVLGALGQAYLLLGDEAQAERYLRQGVLRARGGEKKTLAANLYGMGELNLRQKRYTDAYAVFDQSAALAREASKQLPAAQALVATVRVAAKDQDTQELQARYGPAIAQVEKLPDAHDKAYLLLALGRLAQAANWDRRAQEAFDAALAVSSRAKDRRAESYALGYLGQLYEQDGRFDAALELTRRAAFRAQGIDASEILYLWQWQTGRLLKAKGDVAGAIEAYRRSVFNLQRIRRDLLPGGSSGLSFREAVGPVFFELADLLLQRRGATDDKALMQTHLLEARDTLESLKNAELEDYFQDDCVTAYQSRITRLDKPPPQTAVLYPILLASRMELLLTLPDGIKQYTVDVERETLTAQVRTLRRELETLGEGYRGPSRRLYDFLIRPLQRDLAQNHIETLVIVPDGPLRTIPMAALHDGEKYLVERYALASTPSISLTDPQPIGRHGIQALLGGLTKGVQGFPALTEVKTELTTIEQAYRGTLLLDRDFVIPKLENQLTARPYNVVHIATHGQFDRDPSKTFLLTYNDKLTMNRLEQLIAPRKFADAPVELLTLSACQTALGDDRSALGLAGIAVKAGARSALASLWSIADESTALLMSRFYEELRNEPAVSKAKALQRAQLGLIKNPDYRHPFFWSAFLLIGNWL
ncbi:MAG: CHAT domain-containing protein [Gammaproteobacteria bacterium]